MKLEEFAANNAKPLPPLADVDMRGKTIVITGANTGIGYELMRYYLEQNASNVVMLCRSEQKATEAKERIVRETKREESSVHVELVDFSSFASVQACADRLLATLTRLDILHSHAGLGLLEKALTKDGYETVAQVNALSCMQLAVLLHPLLVKTAAQANGGIPTRSVFTCTDGIYFSPKPAEQSKALRHLCVDNEFEGHQGQMGQYIASKLFLAILVREYARLVREAPVAVLLAAPGLTQSEFGQKSTDGQTYEEQKDVKDLHGMSGRTVAEGAKTVIVAATEPLAQWNWKAGNGQMIRLSNSVVEPEPNFVNEESLGKGIWSEWLELLGARYIAKLPKDLVA